MLINKIYKLLKEEGFSGVITKIKSNLFLFGIMYEYDLNKFDFNKSTFELPDNYSFHYADEIPVEILKKFSRENRAPGQFERTIQPNLSNENVKGICILYKKEEIASLGWDYFKTKEKKDGITRFPCDDNVFFPMDGWVVKKHRGKGFHKFCIYKRFLEAKKRGKKFGYALVYVENIPALKDNDKLGERIGKVYKIWSPVTTTINIYKFNHLYLYFKKHIKL